MLNQLPSSLAAIVPSTIKRTGITAQPTQGEKPTAGSLDRALGDASGLLSTAASNSGLDEPYGGEDRASTNTERIGLKLESIISPESTISPDNKELAMVTFGPPPDEMPKEIKQKQLAGAG